MRKAITVIMLCSILCLTGCGNKEQSPTRQPALVAVKTVEKAMSGGKADAYSASVEPYSKVQLSFRGRGYVTYIHRVREKDGDIHFADPGDTITAGTVLATLRTQDFKNQVQGAESQYGKSVAAVKGAEAQVMQTKAMVDTALATEKQAEAGVKAACAVQAGAQDSIEQAKAQFERNSLEYDRAKALLASDSMAKAEYDTVNAAYKSSKAQLDGAREQYNAAVAQVRDAKAKLQAAKARVAEAESGVHKAAAGVDASKADVLGADAQLVQAQLDYDDSFLRSPITGVILSRNIELGNQVQPGIVAFEMADIDAVKITFGVPDIVVNKLRLGQEVDVICDAVPGTLYKGYIMTLSAGADQKERSFKVVVKVKNKAHRLLAGMIASLKLTTDDQVSREELMIPLSAIVRDAAKPDMFSVFIVEGKGASLTARLREIETGEAIGNQIIVKNGLVSGDRIITAGANLVKDGDPVKIGE
ncbi:MAG: efflux RND transporter periplasmic adaptor subunit [Vulcanimicrobiota bacterium]